MQRITGAAAPLILADGTQLRFSPLTDRDTEEIDEWLGARIINTARNSFTPSTSQAERDELLAVAMRQAVKTTFATQAGVELLATIPGMAFVCWLSLRKEQPHLTVPKVMELLVNAENLDRAKDVFRHVNGLGKMPSPDGTAKKKRQRKR